MVTILIQLAGAGATDPWQTIPLKQVDQIELTVDAFGAGWKSSAGLRINDLRKPNLPEEKLPVVEALAKQLLQIGVRSAADYSLVRTADPLNTVTVRLFIFEDAVKCRAWWKKKYQYTGWQEHYQKLECQTAHGVRSLQTHKSAIAFGNVWLTTHQLGKGNEHIQAANQILKLLTNGKRSFGMK